MRRARKKKKANFFELVAMLRSTRTGPLASDSFSRKKNNLYRPTNRIYVSACRQEADEKYFKGVNCTASVPPRGVGWAGGGQNATSPRSRSSQNGPSAGKSAGVAGDLELALSISTSTSLLQKLVLYWNREPRKRRL
jgi:hypothetical protein